MSKGPETLLVLAKNRDEFDKWVRKWGVGLKNISIVHASEPSADWEGNIFYTALPDGEKMKEYDKTLKSLKKYKYVSYEALERKLKNVKVHQSATQ